MAVVGAGGDVEWLLEINCDKGVLGAECSAEAIGDEEEAVFGSEDGSV